MAGCIFDSDKKDDIKGEYLDSYFPLNPKLTRSYTVTTFQDSLESRSTMTRFFSGIMNFQGTSYYILQSTDSEKYSYYRIDNNILYRFYFENEKYFVPYKHEEPLLDFTKNPGESWLVVDNTITETSGETTYTLTATYIGLETVQVPAGTFEGCARYDNFETFVNVYRTGEGEKTQRMEMKYSTWYARSIGLVKATSEGDFFGNYLIELDTYTLKK